MFSCEESDKLQLRGDAKRLFEEEQDGHGWDHEFSGKYRSRTQRDKRGVRDGTAFASVALPAHYSAITSVLSHLKHRLGKQWHVSRVFDWGAGAGSGLWFVKVLHTSECLLNSPLQGFAARFPETDPGTFGQRRCFGCKHHRHIVHGLREARRAHQYR